MNTGRTEAAASFRHGATLQRALRESSSLSISEAQGNATVCIDKMHSREFIQTDVRVRRLLVAQLDMGRSNVDAKKRRVA